MRKSCGANYAVQPNLAARRRGYAELRAGKGLTADAVPLLDNELSSGLVFEGEADCAALLDLDGLRLGVDDEAIRGLGFRHNDAFPRLQPFNANFPMSIRAVDTIRITNS